MEGFDGNDVGTPILVKNSLCAGLRCTACEGTGSKGRARAEVGC